MCRPITASNLSPESQSCTLPSMHSMLPNTSALARAFSLSSAHPSKSSDVTRPLRPTIRAANSDTSPTPQPISRTRIPAEIPARRKRCSVNGFKIEACRANRRRSRSSWPITYADLSDTAILYHCKSASPQLGRAKAGRRVWSILRDCARAFSANSPPERLVGLREESSAEALLPHLDVSRLSRALEELSQVGH